MGSAAVYVGLSLTARSMKVSSLKIIYKATAGRSEKITTTRGCLKTALGTALGSVSIKTGGWSKDSGRRVSLEGELLATDILIF